MMNRFNLSFSSHINLDHRINTAHQIWSMEAEMTHQSCLRDTIKQTSLVLASTFDIMLAVYLMFSVLMFFFNFSAPVITM